ncbi:hypothetical protein [Pasteurella multocida]|uniref:hypothetical protein n=1 Tax=Pasteurella multocida TaxID=747 RepID=UPI000BBD010B|nr:hypothetical protein [Pasteurella multocida]ATF73941.1 hypothetical protein CO688_00475 [Pasteurella multocida]ATN16343.1 hypothetical protein CRN72_00765 [Pasteurella multocida]HDR1207952.1 hypothetical protein [Pasteurella multocida]HDR1385947.1 hypothetical protein [Pasteurella multocida]
MTLGEIQEMAFNLREAIKEFNTKSMPSGFFLCEEPDRTLLITDEETNTQTIVSQELMNKTRLTKKEILALFERGSF